MGRFGEMAAFNIDLEEFGKRMEEIRTYNEQCGFTYEIRGEKGYEK